MDAKTIHDKLLERFGEKITGAGLEAASPFAIVARRGDRRGRGLLQERRPSWPSTT